MISHFRGKYAFLSNFYEHPIAYRGVVYRNSEAAFQAQKCPSRAQEFANLSGKEAKKLGRHVDFPINWLMVRVVIMEEVLMAKFSDPELRQKLLDTGDEELVEGNNWNDRFWGVDGSGENYLGKLLMKVRSEIRKGL